MKRKEVQKVSAAVPVAQSTDNEELEFEEEVFEDLDALNDE